MPALEMETLTVCMVCGSEFIELIDPEAALSRCRSCGYVFDNPRPSVNALVSFYSTPTKYDSWLLEENARARLWARRLKKMRRTASPGSLLDVGAGIGQLLDLARRDYRELSGTEVSSSAVNIAREKYGLKLYQGTLESLPMPPESFDNITAFHVLEHVPNPRLMIERCFSLLRNKGVLMIAVPNDYRSLKSRLRRGLGHLGVNKYRGAPRFGLRRIRLDGSMGEIHLSHFTPKVLRFLLEVCGFSVIKESVDRYYVPHGGLLGLRQDVEYSIGLATVALTGMNIYDTIWMVGQKKSAGRGAQNRPIGF